MITSQLVRNLAKQKSPETLLIKDIEAEPSPSNDACVYRYVRQGKKLSQLIAKSWIEQDGSNEIRKIFLNFVTAEPGNQAYQDMEDLLSGKKEELCGEIFSEQELNTFLIEVVWDSFEGGLFDVPQGAAYAGSRYFILRLPYPPRPSDFNVNVQILKENPEFIQWLKSQVDVYDNKQIVDDPFPPFPYFPSTSC